MEKIRYLAIIIVASVLAGGLASYFIVSGHQLTTTTSTMATGGLIDSPTPKDVVTVMVHDKSGNLISKQVTNNIITTAGAAFYCIQAGLCAGSGNGAIIFPTVSIVAATPTYWIQFVNGSAANTNEPTAADCSVSSSNVLSGQVTSPGTSSAKCVINFGSGSGQQYPSGSNNVVATLCVSATTCSGDLRASSGIVDSGAGQTNTYALATQLFAGCSPNSNGTGLSSSGTCVNEQQTSVFSNNISPSHALVITGLGLYGGNNKAVVTGPAGPILVAEASLSPITLNPGDTIQVTWQITI